MRFELPGRRRRILGLAGLLLAAGVGPALPAQQPGTEPKTTGWVCGLVVDETFSFVAEAQISLLPRVEPGAPEPAPVAQLAADPHGAFCIRDLAPGLYQLRVARPPWPIQPPRTVEARAGLLNRLTPIELELEPGEPRISFPESFDGMSPTEARGVMERLLERGDATAIQELARRLLPKRGPRLDLSRLVLGLDTKPLVLELIRQLDTAYLPPLKTARYLFVIGELADARTRDLAMNLFLARLRDSRRLPPSPYGAGNSGQAEFVSDLAIGALARSAGKDFGWKYGQPPLQNQKAIQAANVWWQNELDRRQR